MRAIIIGCGLTALSVCIKFDVLKIKKYEDPNNHKDKEDMCYYLLIAALIIIFVGPKDLPVVLRGIGKWWGKIRNFATDFKSSINQIASETGVEDIKSSVEDLDSKKFTDEMRDSINKSIVDSESKNNKDE